jgi:low molecular weight protein-tyrosine phosphatase
MTKILFVCLGNICRSAMAEGILTNKVKSRGLNIDVESAGTANYHIGQSPDKRMQQKAIDHGLNISEQRGRQFAVSDFDEFNYIFAMDESNRDNILQLARSNDDSDKVELFLNLSQPNQNLSVPDPYYGGEQGFEDVYQMLNEACDIFLNSLENE